MKVGDRVVCIDADKEMNEDGIFNNDEFIVDKFTDYLWHIPAIVLDNGIKKWYPARRFKPVEPNTFKNETTAELAKELTEKLKELDRQPEKELA